MNGASSILGFAQKVLGKSGRTLETAPRGKAEEYARVSGLPIVYMVGQSYYNDKWQQIAYDPYSKEGRQSVVIRKKEVGG